MKPCVLKESLNSSPGFPGERDHAARGGGASCGLRAPPPSLTALRPVAFGSDGPPPLQMLGGTTALASTRAATFRPKPPGDRQQWQCRNQGHDRENIALRGADDPGPKPGLQSARKPGPQQEERKNRDSPDEEIAAIEGAPTANVALFGRRSVFIANARVGFGLVVGHEICAIPPAASIRRFLGDRQTGRSLAEAALLAATAARH